MCEPKQKVLVIEDEVKIRSVIKSFLESKGFFVLCAEDGRTALEIFFDTADISMVLLDLMLPLLPGEEVCRKIRQKSAVPVIMLTAKASEADMLHGLGIGADDYITKPFSLKALYARMEAVWRRTGSNQLQNRSRQSFAGDLTVDFENRLITRKSEEIKLTPNEYKILSALIKYSSKVFTRDELISYALGEGFEGYDRTVDSHIKNLRAKLEDDPKNPVYVKTIHGVGYKFGGEPL